jgi:hypothetical protein
MRLLPFLLTTALAIAAASSAAFAQYKMQTPAGEAPGPWLFGTIGVGKGPDGKPLTTALKGLALKLGPNGEAGIAYDLDLCRVAGAWTGGKFVTPMNLMSRGEYPTAMGDVMFTMESVPGFLLEESGKEDLEKPWKDPRSEPFGPLPKEQVRFKGMYRSGAQLVLKWEVDGVEIKESPGIERIGDNLFVTRIFEVAPREKSLIIGFPGISATRLFNPTIGANTGNIAWLKLDRDNVSLLLGSSNLKAMVIWAPPHSELGAHFTSSSRLKVGASKETLRFKTLIWSGDKETLPDNDRYIDALNRSGWSIALTGADSLWPEPVATSAATASVQPAIRDPQSAIAPVPYIVDTVKLPDPNPWSAPMFIGGFDFFPDGRAAVCTFHGDVFLVSGLEGDLQKVTWRRFASGLYHALGLKIVNGEIYVTCRDGLWRLKDLNNDGECDFYEPFNFDLKVTKSFHEFVFDLQTDKAGNFYFAKAGPVKNGGRGFDEIMSQHGTLMRVSPDGSKLDVVATGFRAPNGIGAGPHGELTSGENEGTWTPACKINWIKPGGFYGVVDLAHRRPAPASYDPPLCWSPKRIDNSGGSQVWVPDDERWGPWGGQMLHLSYGHAALYGVMREEVNGVVQGGVTRFPLKFESGIMRARFHPKDGQLWVAGLRGWQTDGIRNGCLQRVRYTGGPVQMPIELHAKKAGIELRFTSSIDTQSAADSENWNVEVWNYFWSPAYGSPEISTITDAEKPTEAGPGGVAQFTRAQMSKTRHDSLKVKSVTVGTDDRSVFLEIKGVKPVMQMSIRYAIKSADGAELKGEVVNTIHALGE